MKNIFPKTSIFILGLALLFSQKVNAQNDFPYEGPADLPVFTFQSVLGTTVTRETLVKTKPVIVIFFDPNCDHCQQQSTWIAGAIEKFANINLLFVTWENKEETIKFAEKYFGAVKTKVAPGMLNFSLDTQYKIDKWFGNSPVPSIHIYGKDWKHTQSFFNETAIEELLKWAK